VSEPYSITWQNPSGFIRRDNGSGVVNFEPVFHPSPFADLLVELRNKLTAQVAEIMRHEKQVAPCGDYVGWATFKTSGWLEKTFGVAHWLYLENGRCDMSEADWARLHSAIYERFPKKEPLSDTSVRSIFP
jgi:hypothetical protein